MDRDKAHDVRDEHLSEHRTEPTTNHPLNGRRRPLWVPLLLLVAFLLVVAGIYWFGVAVLVPSG